VTRVLSGAVLLAFALAVVWFAPNLLFVLVAELLVVIGCYEYAGLARASGVPAPAIIMTVLAVLTAATFSGPLRELWNGLTLDIVLMLALVGAGTVCLFTWRGGKDAVATTAATLFPSLYLGLPIGAMIAIRESRDGQALFLLMITIVASDTAQYYSGRAFGRRPLAATISPKKTIEGAVGGFVFGPAVFAVLGAWWLRDVAIAARIVMGIAIVALGIAGDLFESMLKRSAGVKDSSALIPGHGGILDRIDALLLASPIYYVVLRVL
jgi:phosphatidate cytidylyltransferase